MKFLKALDYRYKGNGLAHEDDPNFIYQFWCGNKVFTTDLLESPLKENMHILINRWTHIYLGALNLTDLIITKMFRGTPADRVFNGKPLSKTEQEYFSRKVKKKLEAVTSKEVIKVATAVLTRK